MSNTDVKISQGMIGSVKDFLEDFLKWMGEHPTLGVVVLTWIGLLIFWMTLFILARKNNKSMKEALLNGVEDDKKEESLNETNNKEERRKGGQKND